jgi:hypothetical protein
MELEFPREIFRKNIQIPNFIKIRPVGAELLNTDGLPGQTDMMKLVVALRNFGKARN